MLTADSGDHAPSSTGRALISEPTANGCAHPAHSIPTPLPTPLPTPVPTPLPSSREPTYPSSHSTAARSPTPSPFPLAPTKLSYATHPAIIHRIARYASPQLKLAFRATSRTFRLLLDPGLFEHVLTTPEERLASPAGWLPGKPWSAWEDTERGAQLVTWASRLRYVRVLDFSSPAPSGWVYWQSHLAGVEMVRNARNIPRGVESLARGRPIPTLVDTMHLCAVPERLIVGHGMKHVLNILFNSYAAHIPRADLSFAPGAAPKDLVLVFTPHYCSSNGRGGRVVRAHNVHCSILRDILKPIWHAQVESVTFVGLSELDPRVLGLSASDDVEEAVRSAFSIIAFQEPMTHVIELSQFLGTVKFASKAAYRASVGERAYALETEVAGATEPHRPVCLDHLAYPHLLDRVIATAGWEGLVALRAASRALKQRVDPVLFAHVSVLPGSLPYLLFVRGNGGRLPGVESWNASLEALVEPHLLARFAHTTVLDVPCELDPSVEKQVRDLLPNLQVVRNLSPKSPTCLTTAPSEVIYSPLQHLAREEFTRFVSSGVDSTTKLVNNHLYDASYAVAPELPAVALARKQPKQIVLVFTPVSFPSATKRSPPPVGEFLDDVENYIVNAVCRRRVGRESAELTLVGVGEMAAAYAASKTAERATKHVLLDAKGMDDGRLASTLLLRAWNERGHEWRVPDPGETEDNLRFVSLKAYLQAGVVAYWETEAPSLEAMYAAGWAPARS